MDGELAVESEAGKGSRFFFTLSLPTGTVAAAGGAVSEVEPALSRPLRILVAEDSEINQLVAQFILDKQGHRTVMVNNGLEAVHRLAEEAFDVMWTSGISAYTGVSRMPQQGAFPG